MPTGIDEEQYDTVRKYYDVFLSDLNGQDIRNIAIISNRICEQKGRKYLKIVGLDVFTGKVVSLIDNHGKNYGLCSYSEDCAKLKSKMVIKVPVELCENVFVQAGKISIKLFNVLRIKGKHEVLGTTNWFKLKEKYEKLHYTSKSDLFNLFIQPISAFKVFELFKNSENLSFYIPVRFPGTHYIKTEGAKATLYNPETRKSFNFISTTKKLLYNTGKYMDGIVIAKITIEDNKTTVLIDKAIICKYFRYSKSERNNDFFRKIEQYYADLEAEDMASYPEYIYDSSGYDDDEADYSDKYRLYDSMEEYCDEYEKFRELETSDEKYFWY
ncbi:MAG: hypothetical protein PUF48_06740 [Oscillospiraceae bacterium]|nr:hypothetical protein [Oscillospiraceae bacterium]